MKFCGTCGKECHGIKVDNGIGPFEHFGNRGVDHSYTYESTCCDAQIFENEELTVEYEPDEYEMKGIDPDDERRLR